MAKVRVSEDQVLSFRARRGHLAGSGAPNVTEAARSILGAQSQQLQPSLLALSMRTKGRPTASEVRLQIFGDSRSLVRTWGQRDTIHLYDASQHWRQIIAANQLWSGGGRGGELPSDAALTKARLALKKAGGIATRSDVIDKVPAAYVKAIQDRASLAKLDAKRFAAGRLFWRLAYLGDISIAEKIGTEQSYVMRHSWFGELSWPDVPAEEANLALTRDYLRVYGPATPHDVAHFLGAKVTSVRKWLERIDRELTPVSVGERENLVVLTKDLRQLRRKSLADDGEWPVRLLPLWESMLMGHADKSWTVPVESERKAVWRKSAMVSAVVLAHGRVVATWTQKSTSKRIKIQIQPLSGWRKTRHLKAVQREAAAIAGHLELAETEVEVT